MKIRDIVAIVAVALAAGGCNQNDEGLQQEGRVPILLRASVDDAAKGLTRAATAKTTQDTELIGGQRVDAYIKVTGGDWLDSGTQPLQYQVDGNSGNLEPVSSSEPARYYPVDSPYKISIYAVHPSYTSGDSFSVATDQTDEGNYAVSDLCYSKTADYGRQSGRQTLTFKHVLSKIVVNLTTNTGATLPTAIKLQAKKTTTMTYPTGSGDCSVPAEATGDVATFTMGLTSDGTTSSGAIVIPPQTVSAGTSFISFTVDGIGPMYYPLPANTTFESGKRYTYNIKVNNTGITVTTDVNDWGTKMANETVMGKRKSIKLNPLWYVAKYNLNSDGTFNQTESTSQGYLFSWSQAMNLGYTKLTTTYDGYNLPDTRKTVGNGESGVTWHIPTHLEYHSIMPHDANLIGGYTANSVVTEVACTFGYNNDTKYGAGNSSNPSSPTGNTYKAYWGAWSNPVMYAIRFLDTDYCSVWRYKWYDKGTTTAHLEISAKLITKISSSETTLLASLLNSLLSEPEGYWAENEGFGAVQRTFYCCGYNTSGSGNAPGSAYSNSCGYHWSTTMGGSAPYHLHFNFNSPNMFMYQYNNFFSVRLFRDN